MTLQTAFPQSIGYAFSRIDLQEQALTHKSFANENKELGAKDNERLEFLGDAVLDLALSDLLMKRYPDEPEGALSKRRASLVNEEFLARVSTEIGLSAHIRLGKGEIGSGGADKPRIRASAFEALIGAIYLDRGFEAAIKVVDRIFENHIQLPLQDGGIESDFKSRLQEKCQKQHGTVPAYEVVAESGPEHAREYVVKVTIQNNEMGIGQGRTKKQAEQMAAQKALEVWK